MIDDIERLRSRLDDQAKEIGRLRRRQGWLAAVGLVGACLLTLGFTRAAGDVPETIKAHRFLLLDANGRESAIWGTGDPVDKKIGEAYLVFLSDGGMRLSLDGGDGRPSLAMNSDGDFDKGQGHVMLRADEKDGPRLNLWAQKADGYGGSTKSVLRSVNYSVPWGDSKDCVVLTKGGVVDWKLP